LRVLLLFRGAPGCGKSTYIKEHGLEPYTLSADQMRMLYGGVTINKDGLPEIDQSLNNKAWRLLFDILEERMENGEFTVIDAVNSKTAEMNRYKDLCEKYRYRCYCVDMTDVPIETVKERNKQRVSYKIVPEHAIDNIYARFKTQKIPARITVVKPDELGTIYGKTADFNNYEKIHVIGDVHGCYTALTDYFKEVHNNEFPENELFMFLGDYTDRGIENAQTLNYLFELSKRKNVVFLEGNHEKHVNAWAHNVTSVSKEFELATRAELESAGVSQSEARQFYRKLWQMAHFRFGTHEFLITHGGLSCMPENLTFISTKAMIKGIGTYKDSIDVDNAFMLKSHADCIQIHGHRNVDAVPVQVNDKCYNLEGKVEFGGCLRTVTLHKDGTIEPHEQKNTVFREVPVELDNAESAPTTVNTSVADMIMTLRNSRLVREKKEGNISSFNFTRDAFVNKSWNAATVKARGLFVDVPNQKIVARAYDKFFNIGEREDTKLDWLKQRFVFPVTAYQKENGFLGLVSYDAEKDDLFVASKSSTTGFHAELTRDILKESVSAEQLEALKDCVKTNDVTFVFEVIDPVNDPHIIEYPERTVYLLDVVSNTVEFHKLPYEELKQVAALIGVKCKTKARVLDDWHDFMEFYRNTHTNEYTVNGKPIEGYVFEDSTGFMTKMKLNYYTFWKGLRILINPLARQGYIRETSRLTTPIMNYFYAYLKNCKETEGKLPADDIITLRNLFLASEYGAQFKDTTGVDYAE